eukprot:NODE_1637_length_1107_cov_71.497164_g1337_i0.p2 GENE.NODE_1637_length_1107_cov_71.497164_g1337_i0~~NODE_1637_length_1107_cov_71.497164_g1337_i0.p2  ORF type:complete len:78 (-),score=18.54 NODE_1637_length_1107_cov_71.497164_g1337_i0:710-943(-)
MEILKQKATLKCYFELEESFLAQRGKRSSTQLISILESHLSQSKREIKTEVLKSRTKFLQSQVCRDVLNLFQAQTSE